MLQSDCFEDGLGIAHPAIDLSTWRIAPQVVLSGHPRHEAYPKPHRSVAEDWNSRKPPVVGPHRLPHVSRNQEPGESPKEGSNGHACHDHKGPKN